MKSGLKKLKTGIEELMLIIMPIPFFVGIGGLCMSLFVGNRAVLWNFALMSAIGLVLLFLWRRLYRATRLERVLKKVSYINYFIEVETEKHFCIRRTDFDAARENPYIFEDRLIYWHHVKDVTFDNTITNLRVLFKNKEELILPNTYDGWYAFIKQVPIELFPDFDTKIVDDLYKQFEACKICSAIAVLDKVCHNCYNDVWETSWSKEEGCLEIDYLKEEQLSYFATAEEGESLDFSLVAFDRFTDWELLVSEDEILKYSSEFFW